MNKTASPGRTKLIVAALVALALAGALAMLLTQKPVAPQASFATLGGEKLALDSLRGKVVLVNFWATSCPGCIREMPDLAKTWQKYHSRGLETIAVAMSYDPPEYVRQFAEKNGLPFTVALDTSGAVAQAFGNVRVTPTTFVIDKQGQIIQQYVGEPDFVQLHALINSAL
jgi:peroxiredoxin